MVKLLIYNFIKILKDKNNKEEVEGLLNILEEDMINKELEAEKKKAIKRLTELGEIEILKSLGITDDNS